jgi:predicted TIM-barrel fold metal-dependent hydrolase
VNSNPVSVSLERNARALIAKAAGVRRTSERGVRENGDVMLAFASIDPRKGKIGVREARKMLFESDYPLIAPDRWIKDFKEATLEPDSRIDSQGECSRGPGACVNP